MELLTSGRYRRSLKVNGGEVGLDAQAIRQAPRCAGVWIFRLRVKALNSKARA
jgi:hypothetical protein